VGLADMRRPWEVWIAANTTWFVVNFRSRLIEALLREGHRVTVLSPVDAYVDRIHGLGAGHHPLVMDNAGTNPLADGALVLRLIGIFRRERPDVLLTFTPKVNIYCSMAGRLAGIPVLATISGLGSGFIQGGWLTWVVRQLYRAALRHPYRVFFQNEDDRRLFERNRLVRPARSESLPGSGVDLARFDPSQRAATNGPFVFLLAARLLWDKGLAEFVEAARILRAANSQIEFRVVGFLDVKNPSAVPRQEVASWQAAGLIRYLGATDDVVPVFAQADCVVLPSYREGTPRCLLEASAMGIPVIATDVAGCRHVVEDGVTGLLCAPRDARDLSEKMQRMLALAPEARRRMGDAGRRKMEREFDESVVIGRYLSTIEQVLQQPAVSG